MVWLKIVTLMIGIILLGISFYISKKEEKKIEEIKKEVKEAKKLEKESMVRNSKDTIEEENMEESINSLVNSLVNRKMLEFNEFANQLLEKIGMNHKEVIFLYDMLAEKEKEMKLLLENIDEKKEKMTFINSNDSEQMLDRAIFKNQAFDIQDNYVNEVEINEGGNNTIYKDEFTQDIQKNGLRKENMNSIESFYDDIMELRKQGKEPIEISKKLKLGTGEVNLVLNLYNEKIQ